MKCADFRFAEAARLTLSQELTAKDVPHRTVVYPEGRHNDACWVQRLFRSFDLHPDSLRRHGLGR